MAVRNKTDFIANEIYYITFTILDWQHVFTSDKYCQLVYKWFDYAKNKYDNRIHGYVIMPNHIHGIIIIIDATLQGGTDVQNKVGATLAVAQNNRAGARPAPTIGEIVGTFKSSCINDWLKYIKMNEVNADGKFWQRNYYEHVIRNESELNRIREYIASNPLKWQFDRENLCRTTDTKYEAEWQWLEGDL